jgi:hypothetical protein
VRALFNVNRINYQDCQNIPSDVLYLITAYIISRRDSRKKGKERNKTKKNQKKIYTQAVAS